MKKIIFILSFFVLAACTSRTIYKKPDDLIAKEEMIQLWTDLFIARAAVNVKNTEQLRKVNYMPFLYDKYKIDSARFMRSNIYYVSKTEDYEKMFEQVEQNILIIKYKNDFDLKGVDLNQPRKILDSIKNARSRSKITKEKIDFIEDGEDSISKEIE